MKKQLFIETIRTEAIRRLAPRKAQILYGLALDVAEETIPGDPIEAANHEVGQVALRLPSPSTNKSKTNNPTKPRKQIHPNHQPSPINHQLLRASNNSYAKNALRVSTAKTLNWLRANKSRTTRNSP